MGTALIIDDDQPMREAVAELLKLDGHDVAQASNGLEALALLGEGCGADVILLDLNMPLMTGWQFLSALEKTGISSAPVIILSSAVHLAPDSPLLVAVVCKTGLDVEGLRKTVRSAAKRQLRKC